MVFVKRQEAQHPRYDPPCLNIESLGSLGRTQLHLEPFPPSTVSNKERRDSKTSLEQRRACLEKSLDTLDSSVLLIQNSILEQEEKAATKLLEGDKRSQRMAMKEQKRLEHLMGSLNDMQLTLKRRSSYVGGAQKQKIDIHDDASSVSTLSGRSSSSLCSHSSSSLCSLSEA